MYKIYVKEVISHYTSITVENTKLERCWSFTLPNDGTNLPDLNHIKAYVGRGWSSDLNTEKPILVLSGPTLKDVFNSYLLSKLIS